jgi:hypothetical protein
LILSIAHASVDDPGAAYIYGAWSNIAVGERPDGLVDCYLSQGDREIHMVSIWQSAEHHDRALEDRSTHPTFGFFAACGLDPTHVVYNVVGRLGGA